MNCASISAKRRQSKQAGTSAQSPEPRKGKSHLCGQLLPQGSLEPVWLMQRTHNHFPESIPEVPAMVPRTLANTVILLVGALGHIFFSYFIFLGDVFSSTGVTKLVICITSLFIIYGKTQASRALYDCYLIHSASWNKRPAISILLPQSNGRFSSFVPGLFLQPSFLQKSCLSKARGFPCLQTRPNYFVFLPSHSCRDLTMSWGFYLLGIF